jgi:hypothetical protein
MDVKMVYKQKAPGYSRDVHVSDNLGTQELTTDNTWRLCRRKDLTEKRTQAISVYVSVQSERPLAKKPPVSVIKPAPKR